MSYHLIEESKDEGECLFCCDELIDPSFNHALVFDQLFQIQSIAPDGDSIFGAGNYCASCGSNVNDIQKLLKELRTLEQKLDEWRNRLGLQLKNSFDRIESNGEISRSRAQKIREEILTQLQQQQSTPTPYTTRSPWPDRRSTAASNLNTTSEFITGDIPNLHNDRYESDNNGPPSPTTSIGSAQSFEDKFVPPEVEVEIGQSFAPTITTEGFAGDPFEESAKLQILEVKRAAKRKSYLRSQARTCPFEPSCGMLLNRSDDISIEAHRLRHHEGVRKCYVCKTCGAGYTGYNSLIEHLELHRSGEATNILEADNSSTSTNRGSTRHEMSEFTKPADSPSLFPMDDLNKMKHGVAVQSATINSESTNQIELDLKSDETEEWDSPSKSKRSRIHHGVSRTKKIKLKSKKHLKPFKDGEDFVCHYCQMKFRSYKLRLFHLRRVHEPEKMNHKCIECNQAFVSKVHYDSHMRMNHTGARPFMCEICSETFTSRVYLRYHQVKHDDSGSAGYKCNLCDKQFSTPTYLSGHTKRVHTRELSYKCDLCEVRVLKKSELQIHIVRKHSEERNFVCNICPATFKMKPALKTHMLSHSDERNFKCSTCGKAFVRKDGLARHELIHSNAQTHVCQVCGKTFPVRNYLYIHMRSHNKPEGKRKSVN